MENFREDVLERFEKKFADKYMDLRLKTFISYENNPENTTYAYTLVQVNVETYSEEKDEMVDVGYILGYLFDTGVDGDMEYYNYQLKKLYNAMDAVSSDLELIAKKLNLRSASEMDLHIRNSILDSNILYLEELYVNEEFRSIGIGSGLVDILIFTLNDTLKKDTNITVAMADYSKTKTKKDEQEVLQKTDNLLKEKCRFRNLNNEDGFYIRTAY